MRRQEVVSLFLRVCVLISATLGPVHASCFASDAKWTQDPPRITFPSSSDHSKVQVDWSTIIKNQRCADKYFLWVWKDGQQKGQGKKFVIADKNTLSKIVDIEQCLFYNFRVELEEDDSSHTDKRASATARFNTASLPNFNNTDVQNYFTIGYYRDPTTQQYDLTKASIKIDSSFLTFANCIKHLEAHGQPKTGAARMAAYKAAPPTRRPNYNMPGGDPVSWGPAYNYPSIPGGDSVSFGPRPSPTIPGGDPISWAPNPYPSMPGNDSATWGPYGSGREVGGLGAPRRSWGYSGNSGYNPGSGGNSGYNPGSGSNSGYNPGSGGNSGYNPGSGGNSGYNPGSGGNSGYNPGSGGNSGYNPGSGGNSGYNPGSGGNSGYNPGSGGNSGYNPGVNRPTTPAWGYNPSGRPPTQSPGGGWIYPTTTRPPVASTSRPSSNRPGSNYGGNNWNRPSFWGERNMFANQFLRMQMPPTAKATGPVQKKPPFSGSSVEIVVPVEPCEIYDFVLKIISPQGKEIGEIRNLELKSLADIDDFVPPPMSSVMLVDYLMGGKFQVKTQTGSPVPESCLPDYMEALDAYANRLETVANENTVENAVGRKDQYHEQQKVEITQAEYLGRQGCTCVSPRLELRMGRPGAGSSPVLGVYLYQGLWEGKPYYKQDLEQRSTKEFMRLTPNNQNRRRRKRFIGRVDGGPTTTTRQPWEYNGYSGSFGRPTTTQPPWNYGSHGGWSTTSSYGSFSTDGYKSSWSSWSSWSSSSHGSSSSSSGRATTRTIPIQRVTTAKPFTPEPVMPRYLYWEPSTKQWLVSMQKGSKSVSAELEGPKNSNLACPADSAQTWTSASPRPGSQIDWSTAQLYCSPSY